MNNKYSILFAVILAFQLSLTAPLAHSISGLSSSAVALQSQSTPSTEKMGSLGPLPYELLLIVLEFAQQPKKKTNWVAVRFTCTTLRDIHDEKLLYKPMQIGQISVPTLVGEWICDEDLKRYLSGFRIGEPVSYDKELCARTLQCDPSLYPLIFLNRSHICDWSISIRFNSPITFEQFSEIMRSIKVCGYKPHVKDGVVKLPKLQMFPGKVFDCVARIPLAIFCAILTVTSKTFRDAFQERFDQLDDERRQPEYDDDEHRRTFGY